MRLMVLWSGIAWPASHMNCTSRFSKLLYAPAAVFIAGIGTYQYFQ